MSEAYTSFLYFSLVSPAGLSVTPEAQKPDLVHCYKLQRSLPQRWARHRVNLRLRIDSGFGGGAVCDTSRKKLESRGAGWGWDGVGEAVRWGEGHGRGTPRPRRGPRGQKAQVPHTHVPTSPTPRKEGWVHLLPPKICCPPSFPEGPRLPYYQFCERSGVSPPGHPPPPTPRGPLHGRHRAYRSNSGAEPTSWTLRLGVYFRRAPQRSGRAIPTPPFDPCCAHQPACLPTGSGIFSAQTPPARSYAGVAWVYSQRVPRRAGWCTCGRQRQVRLITTEM